MCYTAIQLLLFDQHSLQFTSLSHRPKWKNVNEFDPSSVKNRDLEFPYFLTFAKSADARNVYMYCKCCYKLLWWEHKRIDSLFFQFSKHIAYIYVYYLLAQSIITVCVFHYYTQVSAERREAIEKKLHQFKSPQCKHQLCSIFENSMSNSKKNTLIFCNVSEAKF